MKMTKALIKKLCLTRQHPRIPLGVEIPGRVRTRAELSAWLVDEVGFNIQDQDYWDVYRLLRDEFPPAEPGYRSDHIVGKQKRKGDDIIIPPQEIMNRIEL